VKKKFVAVIGSPSAGKSTIIQSLTGAPHKTYSGFIKDRNSGFEIDVIAASPQEKPMSIAQVRARLRSTKKKANVAGLVMAIQPKNSRTRARMEDIFDAAKQEGYLIFGFAISPSYRPSQQAHSLSEVRRRLRAVGLAPYLLNGKRFAHINAAIIRDTVGLF
jgi:energy-coupling factor transporter ATP-binding protein EcfA2